MCFGPAHVVVFANPAFVAAFGRLAVGVPAREVLVNLSPDCFALMDAVLERGRPLARWVTRRGESWRMTVVPRTDPETAEVYGVSLYLRSRADAEVPLPTPRRVG